MRTPRLLLPGALLLLTACGGDAGLPFSADPLQGCFATGARNDKEGGQYFVSFSRGEQWQREPNALHKATRSEISRYFRDDAEQIDGALIRMAGGFGIFHFNKDATLKGKASDSDYMALMLIGAGPVYAVNCP
jgi:hypothetical protein